MTGANMMWPSWQFGIAAILSMVPFAALLWWAADAILKAKLHENRLFMSLLLTVTFGALWFLYQSNNHTRYVCVRVVLCTLHAVP